MATFAGTSHTDVCVGLWPVCSVVAGSKIVNFSQAPPSGSGTLPTDALTVYDPVAGTYAAYNNGLPYSWVPVRCAAASDANTIYFCADYTWVPTMDVIKLNLTTMITTSIGYYGSFSGGSTVGMVRVSGTRIATTRGLINTSTDTLIPYSPNPGNIPVGTVGGRVFLATGTTLREFNPTTGAEIATFTLLAGAAGPINTAVAWGTKLCWSSSNTTLAYVGIDTATDTMIALPYIAGLSGTRAWQLGPDGLFYSFADNNGSSIVLDPTNADWESVDYPTVEPSPMLRPGVGTTARNSGPVVYGGKWWVPSGQPTT